MSKQHSPRFLARVNEALTEVREMNVDTLRERLEADPELLVIDIREDHEYEASHLRGSVHLGKGILERDIEEFAPDVNREMVLYCGGGFRSAIAAESLQRMGYRSVWSLAGGFRALEDAGFEIARDLDSD
jgi:rhodanese-related sulfurtransferase